MVSMVQEWHKEIQTGFFLDIDGQHDFGEVSDSSASSEDASPKEKRAATSGDKKKVVRKKVALVSQKGKSTKLLRPADVVSDKKKGVFVEVIFSLAVGIGSVFLWEICVRFCRRGSKRQQFFEKRKIQRKQGDDELWDLLKYPVLFPSGVSRKPEGMRLTFVKGMVIDTKLGFGMIL